MNALCTVILKIARLLAPRDRRLDWFREWTTELWYVQRERDRRTALWFSLGAFRDALWLRRNLDTPHRRFESPIECLSVLAAAAFAAVFVSVYLLRNSTCTPARPDTIARPS